MPHMNIKLIVKKTQERSSSLESPGLPIICSDRGPMSEILKEARIYFNHEVSSGIAGTVPSLLIYNKLRGKITSNTYLLSHYYSRVK